MSKPPDQPLKRLRPPIRGVAREIRKIWRKFKEFGDAVGVAALKGADLAQDVSRFVKRAGRRFLVPTALGALSPIFKGFGLPWLSESTLASWSPVGALPAILALYLFIRWCFSYIDEEGQREAERDHRERRQPGMLRRLARSRTIRMKLNWEIRSNHKLPPLENLRWASDLLGEALDRVRSRRGNNDVCIALLRYRRKRGFEVVLTRGRIDDKVEAVLHLGKVDRDNLEEFLVSRLSPLEYWNFPVDIDAGPRRYVLVAISGATISDDVMIEIDDTATALVHEYAQEMGDSGMIEEHG